MIWTGATKSEWAKMYNLHRCVAGHEFWYEAFESTDRTAVTIQDACPICGAMTMWTGESYFDWGKSHMVMKCVAGHRSVKIQ